jgi:hypothetical protein
MTNYVASARATFVVCDGLAAFSCAAWAIIDRRYHKFAIASCDTSLSAGRRQRTRDGTQRQRKMPCHE